MGAYLSHPITEKESQEGNNDEIAYGLSAMQGWRVSMEDAHIAKLHLDKHTALFSVFDGHGGKAVAQFAANHMPSELMKLPSYAAGNLDQAMREAYFKLDELLDTPEGKAELNTLVGSEGDKDTVSKGLFSDLEDKLVVPTDDEEQSQVVAAKEEEEAVAGGVDDDTKDAKKKKGGMRRIDSSEKFRMSALQRDSIVLVDDSTGLPAAATNDNNNDDEDNDDDAGRHKAGGMGCTAVSAIIRGNKVYVANTGDSRCVVSQRGEARPLTLDHKPILYDEAQRIIRAGGFVKDNRINGALNVSRTIGDLDFKRNAELPHTEQMVVATPDVEELPLEEGVEFLILACDGIWDVLTNQEAVDFVRKRIKQGQSLKSICEAMCDHCLAPDLKGLCRGADNMSVIVVVFRKHANLTSFFSKTMNALTGLFKKRSPF